MPAALGPVLRSSLIGPSNRGGRRSAKAAMPSAKSSLPCSIATASTTCG